AGACPARPRRRRASDGPATARDRRHSRAARDRICHKRSRRRRCRARPRIACCLCCHCFRQSSRSRRWRNGSMISLLDLFSLVAVGTGTFFFIAGTVGLLRFPDSLSRLHALSKADNLGLGLVVLGLIPRVETSLAAFKLILIWGLVMTSGGSTAQL